MAIAIRNIERKQRGEKELAFIFNVSVEAKFSRVHLEEMLDAITDNDGIAAVGTSFQGEQNGNKISLGRSYRHPRNTGMLISLKDIGAILGGFFNPACDDNNGMEDIEWILRLRALTGLKVVMLDLKVRLIVGVHYCQSNKELDEQYAMREIITSLRKILDLGTPERTRIDETIELMGLEE